MLSKNLYENIAAKVADYQVLPEDIGKILTNSGATKAITITLPNTSDLTVGWNISFFLVADFGVTFASYGSSDDIAAFNDAAADSIAFSTSNEIIGAGGKFVWDGTNWLPFLNLGMDSQTPTVA